MSRSLNADTIEAMRKSDPQHVYHDIVQAIRTPDEGMLEIEFLYSDYPLPDGCNVLREGNDVGVTKSKLVQAFIIARQIFFTYVHDHPENHAEDLLDATSVILLLDPEHITASNTRKRLIQEARTGSKTEFERILKKELRFADGYLTSRLNRHTKSPTLWGHRRWLLEVCNETGLERDILQDLNSVVSVAAERHRMNYYAWTHMRWLVSNCKSTCLGESSRGMSEVESSKIINAVKDWCLRHPGDTSGFSFLLFCLSHPNISCEKDTISLICADILRMTTVFEWVYESVWVFFRTLLASGKVSASQRNEVVRAAKAVLTTHPNHSVVKGVAEWWVKIEE